MSRTYNVHSGKYLTPGEITIRSALAALLGLLLAVIGNAQVVGGKRLELLLISPENGNAQYPQYYSSSGPLPNRPLSHFEKGVQLGTEEAARTGRLLGWHVTLRIIFAHDSVVNQSPERDPAMISFMTADLGGKEAALLIKGRGLLLSAFGSNKAMLCRARTLTITNASSHDAALWDSTDERFGAAQLNARYRSRFHEGMDSNAWAGWFAVKILSEAAFRTGSSRTDSMLQYLFRRDTKFDGHKGVPLQLNQNHILIPDSSSRKEAARCM